MAMNRPTLDFAKLSKLAGTPPRAFAGRDTSIHFVNKFSSTNLSAALNTGSAASARFRTQLNQSRVFAGDSRSPSARSR